MKMNAILVSLAAGTWIAIAAFALQHHHASQMASPSNASSAPLPQVKSDVYKEDFNVLEQQIGAEGKPSDMQDAVEFKIQPTPSSKAANSWLCTYQSAAHTAQFIIELDPPSAKKATEIPIASSTGKFYAVAGSDPSTLIPALTRMLGATHRPINPAHAASLPFTYAVLGEHQTKAPGGGYTNKTSGGWTAMKLFLGGDTEEDEGEVFFNMNTTEGQAEFSIKDPDYGDIVLRHLATIL